MLLSSGHDDAGTFAAVLAVSVLAPAALATYPRLRWRHPVDFVSLVVILGCGVVGVAYADPGVTGLMGLVQGCALLVHTWWRIEVSAERERRALVWMSLALVLTGLLYFFAAFSTENVASGTVAVPGDGGLRPGRPGDVRRRHAARPRRRPRSRGHARSSTVPRWSP